MTTPLKSPDSPGYDKPLTLNPGPPPRRQSKVSCKCVLWSLLVVAVLGGGYLGGKVAYAGYRAVKEPHRSLYQDMSVPYRKQDVVQPLVDTDQAFDIVATVWLRTERTPPPTEVEDAGEDVTKAGVREKVDQELVEKAIFTETVFRGLKLGNKTSTTVKFRVPTEIFKKRDLQTYDLRGSFVLIPNSPSPLDRATNYSTWIPQNITYPRSRSWQDGYKPSLAEEIVDAYGTFTPLLSFHSIKSRCGTESASPTSTGLPDSQAIDNDEEYDEDKDDESIQPSFGPAPDRFSSLGKPILQSHPYIKTRTFLRVVDMTKLYNRKAYDKAHNLVKVTSCGQTLKLLAQGSPKAGWRSCVRSFRSHGNQHVKVKVTKKTEETGKSMVEWVYAPYLSVSETALGPLDLVPVPVNREQCANKDLSESQSVPDEDFVDITWNLGFVGITPAKLLLADVLTSSTDALNMTDTEANQLAAHHSVELLAGLTGHRFRDNYHPRRSTVLSAITFFLILIEKTLELHYWYSRASTVGISITGNALVAGGTLVAYLCNTISDNSEMGHSIVKWIWTFAFNLVWEMIPLFMLKAILRADIYWSSWIPGLRFAPASHVERASRRLESQTSNRFMIIVFLSLSMVFNFFIYKQYYLINPRGVHPPQTSLQAANATLQNFMVIPALTLGQILQVILNYRSRKFAGTYQIGSVIGLVGRIFSVLCIAPWIIGEAGEGKDPHGLGVFGLTEIALVAALVFQAFKYPSVAQTVEDEYEK